MTVRWTISSGGERWATIKHDGRRVTFLGSKTVRRWLLAQYGAYGHLITHNSPSGEVAFVMDRFTDDFPGTVVSMEGEPGSIPQVAASVVS